MSLKNNNVKDGDYVSYIESLHKNKDISVPNDDIFNKNQNKNITNIQNKSKKSLNKNKPLENKDESTKKDLNDNRKNSSFFMFLFVFLAMLFSYFTENPKYVAIAVLTIIVKRIIYSIIEFFSKKGK